MGGFGGFLINPTCKQKTNLSRVSSVRCRERLSRESLEGWTEVSETVSRRSLLVSVSEVGGFRKSSFAVREQ